MVNAVGFCKALLRTAISNISNYNFLLSLLCSMEIEFSCSRNCKNEVGMNVLLL